MVVFIEIIVANDYIMYKIVTLKSVFVSGVSSVLCIIPEVWNENIHVCLKILLSFVRKSTDVHSGSQRWFDRFRLGEDPSN